MKPYACKGEIDSGEKKMSQLIREVQAKKHNSFELLYKVIWDKAYYYCIKHLRSEEDAQDAVQEIMVEVFKSIDKIRNPDAFYSFLYKIMVCVCAASYKKEHIQSGGLYDFNDISEDLPETDTRFLPEIALDKKETQGVVSELVDKLPKKQRQAIRLYYFEGLKQREIAELTESTIGSVNRRLVVARKTLQKQIWQIVLRKINLHEESNFPALAHLFEEEAKNICTNKIRDQIWKKVTDKEMYL